MSIPNPAQGGAVVVGAAAAKVGADAIRGLPETGAKAVSFLVRHGRDLVVGISAMTAGAALLKRGGRGEQVSAGGELTGPRSAESDSS